MIEGKLRLATVQGEGRQFVAESGTGHALVIDDPSGHTGPKPIELGLLALGGCTGFDIISILRKKRQVVTGYEIELHAEQNPEPPAYFTRVEIKHRLWGQIDPAAVERAIHLSETKYCAMGAMISKTAKIETTFEIVPEVERSIPVSARWSGSQTGTGRTSLPRRCPGRRHRRYPPQESACHRRCACCSR